MNPPAIPTTTEVGSWVLRLERNHKKRLKANSNSGIMLAYFANWGCEINMPDNFNRWVSLMVRVGTTQLPCQHQPHHLLSIDSTQKRSN